MKVSLNWLRQFTDIQVSNDELITKIGAQLGAVEEVIDVGKRYEGIVIAKVVECASHPNADKLSVCKLDDGGVIQSVERDQNGHVQVGCGAPNVRQDMLVAWLPPGSTVPSTYDKDPFTLGARELRGVVSNGMIASGHELAINGDQSGIVEVDIAAEPGTSFAEVYELNDVVIDIENKMFTHRPDCFGVLGVAREVAGIQHIQFKSPVWYQQTVEKLKKGKNLLPLEVRNEIPELVPRFMMTAISDIKLKPSPLIMQTYLSRVGLKPINNIVDITNYLMMLTGQPLHAFDYDKVKAHGDNGDKARVVVRNPREGESIALLNGKTIKPRKDAIMIATESKLIGVGGVMGGVDTEVDENTKNIILECANFDMYSIRRTSMEHGLFTDAVTRFNKGQSPHQNDTVLSEAVAMVRSLSGGDVASETFDIKADLEKPAPLHVTAEFVNKRLGLNMAAGQMATLLGSVEFDIVVTGEMLAVTPPFWRTDISIAEDIVEEVGRLYGYDKLPLDLPARSIRPAARNKRLDFIAKIRKLLSGYGANEVLSYSFVHVNLLEKLGQDTKAAFKLSNALSPDLQYYRVSLSPSLLEKVHSNIRADYLRTEDNEFAIFELNKIHIKGLQDDEEPAVPKEFDRLALVYAADDKTAERKYAGAAYYMARKYLDALMTGLETAYSLEPVNPQEEVLAEFTPITGLFDKNRVAKIVINGRVAGYMGEYNSSVKQALKLPEFSAGFELDGDCLLRSAGQQTVYQPIPRFPKSMQDMTLKVPSGVVFNTLFNEFEAALEKLKTENNLYAEIRTQDIYHPKDSTSRNITFRLWFAHYDRTLTTVEVNGILEELAQTAKDKFGAVRI